jgi:hypothetical protein
MDRREATEILLNIRNTPGYFENIVSRTDDWVGVFSFNLDSPRWNKLMPVPRQGLEAPEKAPEASTTNAKEQKT